jgi:hypothetical protein
MNFNEAEAEIRKFFDTAWAGLTDIAWPDQNFTIPLNETWVRFTCQENDGRQVSMGSPGNNRFRHFGIVTVQVFQPEGNNSIDARTKATAALAAFMGAQTANGVNFFDVTARQIGNDENGFYQINVLSSFYYDEIT